MASALSSCLLAALSLHDVRGLGPVLGSVPLCPTGMSPSRRSSHPGPPRPQNTSTRLCSATELRGSPVFHSIGEGKLGVSLELEVFLGLKQETLGSIDLCQ